MEIIGSAVRHYNQLPKLINPMSATVGEGEKLRALANTHKCRKLKARISLRACLKRQSWARELPRYTGYKRLQALEIRESCKGCNHAK